MTYYPSLCQYLFTGQVPEYFLGDVIYVVVDRQARIRAHYIESYKAGRFDRIEGGVGIFDLGAEDRYSFPELKGASAIFVSVSGLTRTYRVEII